MRPAPHSLQGVEPGFESSIWDPRDSKGQATRWTERLSPYGDSLSYGHPHLPPPEGPRDAVLREVFSLARGQQPSTQPSL